MTTPPLPPNPADRLQFAGLSLPRWRRGWLVAAAVVALVAPLFAGSYADYQLTLAVIYAVAIVGLTLLTGFNGQFSLGHSAFFGLGAYVAAILMYHLDVHYMLTLIPAGVFCFIAGFLFGIPALRLDGLHLALATFALAVAMPQLLRYTHFEELTGGVQGLSINIDLPWLYTDVENHVPYYLSLVSLALIVWAAHNLTRSRAGRAMIAIRDNPIAARSMGVNTALYKATTFGVSGFITGVAGALSAIVVKFVAPESFTFFLAVLLLVGMVIGGTLSIYGAVFGGLFVLYLPNWAESIAELLGRPDAKALSWAVYGVLLILAVYLMPDGAAGLVKRVTGRYARPPGADGPRGDLRALGESLRDDVKKVLRLQPRASIIRNQAVEAGAKTPESSGGTGSSGSS